MNSYDTEIFHSVYFKCERCDNLLGTKASYLGSSPENEWMALQNISRISVFPQEFGNHVVKCRCGTQLGEYAKNLFILSRKLVSCTVKY